MKQVGYEEQWLDFLNTYVRPLQEKVFVGYFSDVCPFLLISLLVSDLLFSAMSVLLVGHYLTPFSAAQCGVGSELSLVRSELFKF